MGSYAGMYVKGRPILWWKNGLSPLVTSLFTKNDIKSGSGQKGLELIKEYNLTDYGKDYSADDTDWEIMIAVIGVKTLRQRLSIYGYNLDIFLNLINELIAERAESLSEAAEDMHGYYKEEIEILERLRDNNAPLSALTYKYLERLDFYNEAMAIWAVLQNKEITDSDVVIIDLDDLAEGGWIDEEFNNTDSDYLLPQGEFVSEIPVIVTEGVTDKRFLQESLGIIYPKLASNIRFLNHDFKPENGASSVIKMVKSFASAGISNRILVVLDNDAAASEAMLSLPKEMPNNIMVIQYPELELLKNYPTIGPQGVASMDVNGLAGSIEMYLGKDILLDDSGKLEKIQWGGYMQSVKKYQGSLLNKGQVQKRFSKKDKNDTSKWADLQHVWDYIINSLSTL